MALKASQDVHKSLCTELKAGIKGNCHKLYGQIASVLGINGIQIMTSVHYVTFAGPLTL